MRTLILIVKVIFMNFNSHSIERLKEERKRLKLTQGDIADICGISREMWGKYERGIAIPGGEVLASLAMAGINIQYILTGVKANQKEKISPEKRELMDTFDEMTPQQQKALLEVGKVMAQPEPNKNAG